MERPWFVPGMAPNPDLQLVDESVVEQLAGTHEQDLVMLYRRRWPSIRSYNYESRRGIRSLYNVRLQLADQREHVSSTLGEIFNRQAVSFKINFSIGLILRHKVTGRLRYFHPSANNSRHFKTPLFVQSRDELRQLEMALDEALLEDLARVSRPDSTWVVVMRTNVALYVYHQIHHPIGSGSHPRLGGCFHPRPNQYPPGLCFFACLSKHINLVRNRSLNATNLFCQWKGTRDTRGFSGVTDLDLPVLEDLFHLNIYVYTLDRSAGSRFAVLLRRPFTVNLVSPRENMTLHRENSHYRLVLHMDRYASSYKCSHCGQIFVRKANHERHLRTCQNQLSTIYKGGPYHIAPTVFDMLERVGIHVEESKRFYPYRLTYDIETCQQKVSAPTYANVTTRHVFLSVSVASNVPGYQQTVCFVSDGDPLALTRRFINYLTEVSERAELLLTAELRHTLDQVESLHRKQLKESQGKNASKVLRRAKEGLHRWMRLLPCFSFNGAKYDLVVLKPLLACLFVHSPYDEDESDDVDQSSGCEGDGDSEEYQPAMKKVKPVEKLTQVAKSSSHIVAMTTRNLLFLDVCSYLAPGVSYAKYLKAFNVFDQGKSFFPYEYVDCVEKLEETALPPYEAFYSTLKKANVLDEGLGEEVGRRRHGELVQLWNTQGMKTLRDFLVHYNNADVGPFLQAIERQWGVYRELGVDMAKDGMTLPGLAMRFSFRELGGVFHTFHPQQADLHQLVMDSIVGGPSIVFKRWAEAGVTRIRPSEFGEEAKVCKSVIGQDCNALYLWALSQDMPTGCCLARYAPDFAVSSSTNSPRGHSKASIQWLEWEAQERGVTIRHATNGGEVFIGGRDIPVDGFDRANQTIYQFHGCLYHGCACLEAAGQGLGRVLQWEGVTGITQKQRRLNTAEIEDYFRTYYKYTVITMKECEWRLMKQCDPRVKEFCRQLPSTSRASSSLPLQGCTESQIIHAIAEGKLFGLCLVDLAVKPEDRKRFAEMPPIFKNVEVGREHIGETMCQYAEKNGILPKPRKMLISSYFGERILMATPLLRWYLRHGLVISAVHLVMEYHPQSCFQGLADTVTESRRKADLNPSLSILGSTYKLIGNAVFGKTGECKARREKRRLVSLEEARLAVNCPRFREVKSLDPGPGTPLSHCRRGDSRSIDIEDECTFESESLSHDNDAGLEGPVYEITSAPRCVYEDLPLHISFFVYQFAKMKMLELRYDFMERFFQRNLWEQLYMDTDSNYMACAVDDLEEALIPEKRREYFAEVHHWLPTPACDLHRAQYVQCKTDPNGSWDPVPPCCAARAKADTRTPGLFKTEWTGKGLVALCSKTYYGLGDTDKLSCKGLQKARNSLSYDQYKRVLHSGQRGAGENAGFRVMSNGVVYSYVQTRESLSYFYCKRKVLPDGVNTEPLSV